MSYRSDESLRKCSDFSPLTAIGIQMTSAGVVVYIKGVSFSFRCFMPLGFSCTKPQCSCHEIQWTAVMSETIFQEQK